MRFSRIKDDLALLEQKGTVTVSDVLGCIYDLCQDVRSETGSGVEQKELGNAQTLGQRLPWLGRMLLRLYARSGECLQSASLRQRLKEIGVELGQMSEELEKTEELNRTLSARELELKNQRRALIQSQQQKALLQQNCGSLEQELERLRDESLPQLQETWNRLQEERQQLDAQARETQSGIDRLKLELAGARTGNGRLQELYEAALKENRLAQAAAEQLQQRLEEEQASQAEHQTRLAELEQKLTAAEQENASLTSEQIPALAGQLEQTGESITDARNRLQKLEEALGAGQELLRSLAEEILQAEQSRRQQQEEKEKQEQEREKKQQALDCVRKTVILLDQECQKLQTRVEQLNEELEQRNFDQIKSNLNAVVYEKEQLLDQYHKLELQIQAQQQEAEQQRAALEALAAEKQTCREAAQQEQEKIRKTCQRVEEELLQLRQQREQMLRRLQSLAEEKQVLESWFESTDAEQCLEQIQRISHQTELMREARDSLAAEHRLYAAAAGMSEEEQEEKLAFQTDIDALAQQLLRFQEEYRRVLHSFGGEV